MKKKIAPKKALQLTQETIRSLQDRELNRVVAGVAFSNCLTDPCTICKTTQPP